MGDEEYEEAFRYIHMLQENMEYAKRQLSHESRRRRKAIAWLYEHSGKSGTELANDLKIARTSLYSILQKAKHDG